MKSELSQVSGDRNISLEVQAAEMSFNSRGGGLNLNPGLIGQHQHLTNALVVQWKHESQKSNWKA